MFFIIAEKLQGGKPNRIDRDHDDCVPFDYAGDALALADGDMQAPCKDIIKTL